MRAQQQYGRGARRHARPRSQVRVLDIEQDDDDDVEREQLHEPFSPQQELERHESDNEHDVDYVYDPAWFEDDGPFARREHAENDDNDDRANMRVDTRARSSRFSAPTVLGAAAALVPVMTRVRVVRPFFIVVVA